VRRVILNGSDAQLDVLPSHLHLAYAEVELSGVFQREHRLRDALLPHAGAWDVILIDSPPSLGILTLNALMAANEVLIPVDPGVFPLIGLSLLRRTISMVQRANPELRITGVFQTLADRTVLSRDTETQLEATFGDLVLPTIPRRVAIGEAHAEGRDIFDYSPNSDGAAAYAALVQEVWQRG
jgi:chromosome partitioning protein